MSPLNLDPESPVRYVAIGDSFTEGIGDEGPDGTAVGWADRAAAGLATALDRPVEYANLAIRGRLLEPIVTEQLDAALALTPKPTLLSLNGGGNDMMRPGTDLARLIELTSQAAQRCEDAGVDLLLLSGADPSDRLPFGAKIHRRGEELTAALAEVVAERPVTFVDAFHDRLLRAPQYWSPDRLHLAPDGHARVAGLVLTKLGYPVESASDPAATTTGGLRNEARYYREHVLPWVTRRLRGRSSGDDRDPKHPGWITVPAGSRWVSRGSRPAQDRNMPSR